MNLDHPLPRRDITAYAVYSGIAVAILLPLLRPGFILTLDMVFTPVLHMPQTVTSSYPFHALLHILNMLIPADVLQKCVLLITFILAGVGMHRLVRTLRVQPIEWGVYAGSILYVVNPFTYSRLMAGQYAVLLGYALLPWCLRRLILFARYPDMRRAVTLGLLVVCIGIVSIHTLGAVAILAGAAGIASIWRRRNLRPYIKYASVTLGVFIVLSSYWIMPLALGQGRTAQVIQNFGTADVTAFATTGGSSIGKLGNIARLQGFWAESRQLYLLPQKGSVLWGLTALMIIGLTIAGLMWLRKYSPHVSTALGIGAVAAAVLATGIAAGPLAAIGLREPHKLVSLVALTYSVGVAYGIHALLQKCRTYHPGVYAAAAVCSIILPLLFTRVMFWGASGQLTARHYPASWEAVNTQLTQDPDHKNGTTLFLPWHQYMPFSFSDNRIIANPAAAYFDTPVIVSTDPEYKGATSGPQTAAQQLVARLLQHSADSKDFGRQLADHHIKYVVLAKEADYTAYRFLATNPDFSLVNDYPEIALYKNNTWRPL